MTNATSTTTSLIIASVVVGSALIIGAGVRQSRATQSDAAGRTATFVCDDKSTLTIEFMSSGGGPSYAKVAHGTGVWMLPQARSASGARYAADGVSVWNKGNDVLFERGSTKLNCTVAGSELAGSSWRLVEFRATEEGVGVVKPDDPSKYTLALGADGRAAVRLNCNRGAGQWSSHANGADSGSFTLGPLAVTKALCAPPTLDVQIARDAEFISSYLIRDGRLYLNLISDGGTYVWARQ